LSFSTELKRGRRALHSLAVCGVWAGRGLIALGVVEGVSRAIDALSAVELAPARRASLLLHGAVVACCWVIFGWGVCLLARLITAALDELHRFVRLPEQLVAQATRAVELLESVLARLNEPSDSGDARAAAHGREAVALTEIERAIQGAHWAEAERLLKEFEAGLPGDCRVAVLREDLAAAKRGAVEESLAQLAAARNASDADRVLELYRGLSIQMEAEARDSLSHELAGWFLGLIHRRLRAGKIQADVVQLAGRFAETFATTAQGASVRASLATLRRSVGLCPRCAQPYTGLAEACAQCLGGRPDPVQGSPPALSDQAQAERTSKGPSHGQVSGWA
jgi:hypothetical protein